MKGDLQKLKAIMEKQNSTKIGTEEYTTSP